MNVYTKSPAKGETAKAAQPSQVAPSPARKRPRWRRAALMVSLPVLLAIGGGWYWLDGGRYVETENAYVQQAKTLISSDVSGRIVDVEVHQNQQVKAGDVLFHVDPEPYRLAVAAARAKLADARLNVEQMKVAYTTAEAKLTAAGDLLAIRKREMARKGDLAGKGYMAQSDIDELRLAYQQALENVELAKQAIKSAAAALDGNPDIAIDDHPAVRAALTNLDNARLNLERTTIKAPADGIVSQVEKLNVGQYAAAGSPMLTLVETGNVWIEANLKETQLTSVKPGQPADISIDAYPDLKIRGSVASIGAGTGSEFSLIPAQNATGNWVKVVQRLPVRLKVTTDSAGRLRTGMSAFVSIDTGKTRLDTLLK